MSFPQSVTENVERKTVSEFPSVPLPFQNITFYPSEVLTGLTSNNRVPSTPVQWIFTS